MESGVYLLQSDNVLIRMNETPYEAESLLQELLENHPDLLAGDQINATSPRRWLLIKREVGVPESQEGADRWSLDHLFLDQDAVPTFVEVKRASDTRARREVVAQMLDYAAHATEHWPVERIREMLAFRCANQGLNPSDEIANLMDVEGTEAEFWNRVGTNLREGRIRLLFVADKISTPLQRIVEFLNSQMNPAEVLAVEVRQFASEANPGARTLIPRVIGQSELTRAAKAPSVPRAAATPITLEEFISNAPDVVRTTISTILAEVEASGLELVQCKRSGDSSWVTISVPGTSGSPSSLTYDYLWISLGRHHPVLQQPGINERLRQAILQFAPTSKSANDPNKTEVGIRLDSVQQESLIYLRELFGALRQGLTQ